MRRVASCLVGFAVVGFCAGLAASEFSASEQKNVEASGAWVKTPAAGETAATAFVTVDNPTQYDIYLTSVAADVAGKVEFRDRSEAGDPQGQLKKTIKVDAFGGLAMDPKGVYLLLADLKRPLKEGDTVALTVTTDGGATLRVSAPVRKE